MQLNLPILDALRNSTNILIAGAGGGQDILIALPLYFTLRELGKPVHLASYSFSDLGSANFLIETEVLIENLLLAVRGKLKVPFHYFIEGGLAQWFSERHGEDVPIWLFGNVGGKPLAQAYRRLYEHLKFDALILVDGGVDSLMRGDEIGAGSLLEDTISISAATLLNEVPVKILACLGFGTEVEEGLCHYHALENMAALVKAGGFYGACALTPQMEAFQRYADAARYLWLEQEHPRSHISTRVIPAVRGEFGNFHEYADFMRTEILVSPLMSLYWFFNADIVAGRSLILDAIRQTDEVADALRLLYTYTGTAKQYRQRRPLPY